MLNRFRHTHDHPLTGVKQFLTDAQRLFRMHMMNKDHTITEEDLQRLRIGEVEETRETEVPAAINALHLR